MLVAGSCDYNGFYGTPKVVPVDGVFARTSPIVGNSELIASVLADAGKQTGFCSHNRKGHGIAGGERDSAVERNHVARNQAGPDCTTVCARPMCARHKSNARAGRMRSFIGSPR